MWCKTKAIIRCCGYKHWRRITGNCCLHIIRKKCINGRNKIRFIFRCIIECRTCSNSSPCRKANDANSISSNIVFRCMFAYITILRPSAIAILLLLRVSSHYLHHLIYHIHHFLRRVVGFTLHEPILQHKNSNTFYSANRLHRCPRF